MRCERWKTDTDWRLRVDFIEATPENSVLEGAITDIVITTGTIYAKAIGATQIKIMKPSNEIIKNYYLAKPGFSFDKLGNFCFKDI